MKTGLSVGEVMTQRPVQVPENLTVRECARIMQDKAVGSLLVTKGKRLLGILTEYDIIHDVVAEAKNADDVDVGEVMTTALLTITPDRDVYDALSLMRDNDIRHVPVLNDDELVGFLTLKDILKVQPQLFELLLDTIDLREEERKLAHREGVQQEGFCEICGNFSRRLAMTSDGRLACIECREA